ncbi:MAG TPA: tetratricopeptide repeat protein [Pseudomonadales bacterium]|nr:tetratricopeptide repeat protein [Pseudomonadales bacterium]
MTDTLEAEQHNEEIIQELTLEQLFSVAQQLHRKGFLNDAEPLYQRILDAYPEQADSLHFLGLLQYQRGEKQAGLDSVLRSIELNPDHPGWLNNLGNIHLEMQQFDEATAAFRRALELNPDHPEAYGNFGALLKAKGLYEEAEKTYLRAIELNPENADVYNNLGNLMMDTKRTREGVAYYCKAITLMPKHKEAKKLLGIAYYTIGEIDKAAQVYREWLEQEPNNPIALHHLAACTKENVPLRAQDDYVETTFDAFAASFDEKLQKLEYRAPQLIADKLSQVIPAKQADLTILDAGCGTGLCGPLVRQYAQQLIGVDLSAGMLEKAKTRGVYDALEKDELTHFIDAHPGEYDVILSADTLVYFGDLSAVMTAAKRALKPNATVKAQLLFTVEAVPDACDQNYLINPHGRYAHRAAYLEQVVRQAGFTQINIDNVILRMESGSPVRGFLVSCR